MRHLAKIIQSLNKEEVRNFTLYISRIKKAGDDKKVIELFKAYRSGLYENDTAIWDDKFKTLTKNAFYRLKNRLLSEVDRSLLLLHAQKDDYSTIYNKIILAKVFSYKSDFESAYNLLQEAEKKALKNEYLNVLDNIYEEIILLSQQCNIIAPTQYIQKKQQIKQQYAELQELNYLIAQLTYELHNTNFQGKRTDIISTLEDILHRLQTSDTKRTSVLTKWKIHDCIKGVLLQKKDFHALKAYLIQSYNDFEREGLFTKNYHQEKIRLLCWLINALLKTKDFQLSLQYTKQLYEELIKYNRLFYDNYIWTYYQSLFANHYFSNRLDASIEVLNQLKAENKLKGILYYDIFLHLNLTTVFYSRKDLSQSMKHLQQLLYKDVFKEMTPELKLNISIVELILHYEHGDNEYVLHRISDIKRTFRAMLKKPNFKRELDFLGLLNRLSKIAAPFKNVKFLQKVDAFIGDSPSLELGSNEAISYDVWLSAKREGKDYYTYFLELVNAE